MFIAEDKLYQNKQEGNIKFTSYQNLDFLSFCNLYLFQYEYFKCRLKEKNITNKNTN